MRDDPKQSKPTGLSEPAPPAGHEHQLDLLGLAEVAELLAISKGALGERRRRRFRPGDCLPPFPAPVVTLRCGPIWLRSQIEGYEAERERLAKLTWFHRVYGEDAIDPIDQALHGVKPLRFGR